MLRESRDIAYYGWIFAHFAEFAAEGEAARELPARWAEQGKVP